MKVLAFEYVAGSGDWHSYGTARPSARLGRYTRTFRTRRGCWVTAVITDPAATDTAVLRGVGRILLCSGLRQKLCLAPTVTLVGTAAQRNNAGLPGG